MILVQIDDKLAFGEHEKEANELLNILRNSNSRYKEYDSEKIKWFYSFSYFTKKSEKTPEYYENLYKMPFEDRLKCEMNRVRLSLGFSAGHFYISDRVDKITDIIKDIVTSITYKKILFESELLGDDSILKTIPFVIENDLKEKELNYNNELSLQDQLKICIDNEEYEKAAFIRDKIKNEKE
jgi:hypothetical protein